MTDADKELDEKLDEILKVQKFTVAEVGAYWEREKAFKPQTEKERIQQRFRLEAVLAWLEAFETNLKKLQEIE